MKLKALTILVGLVSLPLLGNAQASEKSKIVFFEGTFQEALQKAKKTKKPLILDFWAEWCKSCRKLESETFSDEEVSKLINKNYIAYRVNIDYFEGMDIADKYKVQGFPSLVMLDSKGKDTYRMQGFYPPEYFLNELKRTTTFSLRN